MATLGTVNPDWTGVIHTNSVSGEGGGVGTNGFTGEKVRQKDDRFSKSVTYNPELKPLFMGLQGLAKVD